MNRVRRSLVPINNKRSEAWSRPTTSSIETSLPTPAKIPEDVFRVTEQLKASDTLGLKDILKEPTWPTTLPKDFIQKAAKQSLLLHMAKTRTFDTADHYWHCNLLPEQCVCLSKQQEAYYLVLRVCPNAGILVFPVLEENSTFLLDRPKELMFQHVDDISEWLVAPCRAVSPKTLCSQGIAGLPGIRLRRTGQDSDVLPWHCASAFARVDKATKERLIKEFGIEISSDSKQEKEHPELSMSLALVAEICPAWDHAKVAEACSLGQSLSSAEDTALLQPILDDLELLEHVVPKNEANQWTTWVHSQREKGTALIQERLLPKRWWPRSGMQQKWLLPRGKAPSQR
eukprot:10358598-Lingulodinium_polyedra.AAC.1